MFAPFIRTPLRVTVPAEFATPDSLLAYLGLSVKELRKIWWYRERMYHQFEISKVGGKSRVISAPDRRLKHLQRQLAPLLDQLYRVRHPVHGFVTGKSVRTNALAHLQARFVMNLDIKEFFPSITETRVSGLLRGLNIDARVAKIVARLCCCAGRLPQGAPTSPVLSNMICFRLDRELLAFAKSARCIYTRYADDITFSSHQPMTSLFDGQVPAAGHFPSDILVKKLKVAFSTNGFSINPTKAHYADRHSRRMVTGIKINELLNVDRRFVRNIRAALFSVETLGLEAAQAKFSSQHGGRTELRSHLEGKVIWLRHIRGHSDPVFRGIALRFNKCFPRNPIQVAPSRDEARDRSVWVVEHFEGEMAQGSAFFLKGVGLVTAAHCVEGVEVVEVYHPSKPANKFRAAVHKRDEDRDLAILRHDIPQHEYFDLGLSSETVTTGDELTAVGYPNFGPGDRLNVRRGTVSSMPTKSGLRMIEVTQKLAQGMSGGPLLDKNDAVVGIVHKGGPYEARDFAIRIDVLLTWLNE